MLQVVSKGSLSWQEDSEDSETGRRPSEDLMSDVEQASEDGKNTPQGLGDAVSALESCLG